MMHKGTFSRAAIRTRKRTLVHRRAETLRTEKIVALSDPNLSTNLYGSRFTWKQRGKRVSLTETGKMQGEGKVKKHEKETEEGKRGCRDEIG